MMKRINWHRLFFIIYLIILIKIITANYPALGNNFTLFREILRYQFLSPLFIRNVIGNVILFIPLGFYLAYFYKINKIYLILIISFIISLMIEVIQFHIGRAFDVDDILLNVIGGLIGYFLYQIFKRLE